MSQKRIKRIKKQEIVVRNEEEKASSADITFWGEIKKHWKYLVIVLAGTVILYLNGQNANFVSDDYATIPQFEQVTDFGIQVKTLNLPTLSNWLLASLFGNQNPLPFHMFNLFMYLVILVLGFVMIEILLGDNAAKIATVIFASMPIHVEGVTWISGKPYTFNTLFVTWAVVITLLLLLTKKRQYLYFLLCLLPWVFMADKVRFFSYIFIMILIFISFGKRYLIKFDWKKYLLMMLPFFVGAIIFLIPKIIERINVVNGGYNASESIFYNPFFQYPTAIAKYLQLMWFPTDLTLYHTMYTFPVWLNWAITLTYMTATIYFFFKNKNIFFSLIFIFLAASPSMAPVKVSWLVAERYMFLGSWGFAMFLALIVEGLWRKFKIIMPVFLACFLIYGCVRTFLRNDDWTTNHKLWVNTCQVSPNSHNAWNNIGDDYDKLKDYENAVKGFTQSTIVKPNYADAYHNRANIFFKTNRLDLARESYNIALSFSPSLYQTFLSLTQIDIMEKKFDLALGHAGKALELQPNNPQNMYVLGVVYANMGDTANAVNIFKTILQRYPGYKLASDALINLEKLPSKT